ncbi:hypothetical protein [Jiangella mangrovi]|uniref:Uncharacterized protein involved in copper resistance n=1 Tax=Jiangella mangrovi TaxID=1524084 RepID=A0A7W9GQH6_9ACTN|nr:hypothetical protein [Jiangella mangrovi]MBB5787974.1 uncharacterized protein involved in copper resistance [Jiangella mangrovi]
MTRTTRTVPMLGAAAALVLALTACSSDSGSEYCDLISGAEENSSLTEADPTDPEAMDEITSTFRDITDAAPDDIKGDWETLTSAFESFAAGEAPTDPESTADMDTALENIEQHVQDECDIELS